jgi:hypothetical protein
MALTSGAAVGEADARLTGSCLLKIGYRRLFACAGFYNNVRVDAGSAVA